MNAPSEIAGIEGLTLMFAAKDELAATMGVGKNAPRPEQILTRMAELLAEAGKKEQLPSVPSVSGFENQR